MAKDIQGVGLGLASKFAGSRFAEKYKLRKSAEKMAYLSTRTGFKVAAGVLKRRAGRKPVDNTKLLAAPQKQHQLFDLSLSDEQQMIKDTVRAYASDVLRELALAADEEKTLPTDFLANLGDIGLNYFSVPEALGGAAQSYSPTTSAIIAEQLAWGDMTLAYAALAPTAVANAIVRWGTAEQKKQYLPRYLEQTPIKAAIAVQEAHPLFEPQQLSCKAKKNKHGYVLNGSKTLVPFADGADLYLVAAQFKGQPAIFIVPGNSAGLSVKAGGAMGLRAAQTGQLQLNNVQLPADARLGADDFHSSRLNYQEFIDLGQLHWCALALGCCQAALDYVITYCNEREAFGEPISHRQSVAFIIADIGIELESMRLLTWRAAALAEEGKAFHREAFLAHTLCAEKAMKIGTDAVQLLGGHGFTKEHPAERWYRDLRVLACVNSGLHL